jgi:hypothetical protein
VSFKKRAVQKFTLDNNIAPNPPLYGQEFNDSFLRIFKHCIDIHRNSFIDNDYNFWAVIFEDEVGGTLHRQDMTSEEIKSALRTTDDFIKIWRTFNTEKKPTKWIVWPHSESKGWLNKIEGSL